MEARACFEEKVKGPSCAFPACGARNLSSTSQQAHLSVSSVAPLRFCVLLAPPLEFYLFIAGLLTSNALSCLHLQEAGLAEALTLYLR